MKTISLNDAEFNAIKVFIKDILDHPEIFDETLVAVAKGLYKKLLDT